MQIRVEIEVTPEELRRFLGVPDVSGLQEDIISFLRDKVGQASELDPSGLVKNFAAKVRLVPQDDDADGDDDAPPSRSRRRGK